MPGVHISDLTTLYEQLVTKILQKEPIRSGEEGYYIAIAHSLPWWDVLDRLAGALHARGLVADTETQIWPSDEVAAEYLGIPAQFVQLFFNCGYVLFVE